MEQRIIDIETGMVVYGGNGQIIGTVSQAAGFGSTRIDPATDPASAPRRNGGGGPSGSAAAGTSDRLSGGGCGDHAPGRMGAI
jgi:hypothetical protein